MNTQCPALMLLHASPYDGTIPSSAGHMGLAKVQTAPSPATLTPLHCCCLAGSKLSLPVVWLLPPGVLQPLRYDGIRVEGGVTGEVVCLDVTHVDALGNTRVLKQQQQKQQQQHHVAGQQRNVKCFETSKNMFPSIQNKFRDATSI